MAPNKVAIVYGTFFMGNSENDANVIAKEFPADKFPGDHPAIADVLRAAGISLVDAEGVAV